MKNVFMKLLRVLHIDVALLGLIEKLSLGLVKKLDGLSKKARNSLNRALQIRDEKQRAKSAKKQIALSAKPTKQTSQKTTE